MSVPYGPAAPMSALMVARTVLFPLLAIAAGCVTALLTRDVWASVIVFLGVEWWFERRVHLAELDQVHAAD